MTAPSAKGLFRSTGKVSTDTTPREANDFYPTPPEVTRALLAVEGDRLRAYSTVWEAAAGDGAMADVLEQSGFSVIKTDLIDRGCGAELGDYFSITRAPAKAMITNPPYHHINARDGKGRWLTHAFDLDLEYIALFLNWDWPAAAGLGGILARYPISRAYVARWKVDFTGKGAPPQRNGWFIWDREWEGETALRFLDRHDERQGGFSFDGVLA
jgi:hypothetical protein